MVRKLNKNAPGDVVQFADKLDAVAEKRLGEFQKVMQRNIERITNDFRAKHPEATYTDTLKKAGTDDREAFLIDVKTFMKEKSITKRARVELSALKSKPSSTILDLVKDEISFELIKYTAIRELMFTNHLKAVALGANYILGGGEVK
ncbi:hypothetical protein [Paenilisteria newyorkensis]|uniref:hypothetical protein n=1 Tax=Listeria newyorkensis TaxID=1497681 RepID=UPI000669E99D|nr:hypothetical protein [Listeria newyorkensis]KMT62564.1 hypothetical protein X559_1102 [Listeria newyorkensis]